MLLYPNAKINIGFQIVGRRANGYHDIQSVYYPISTMHDVLELDIDNTVDDMLYEQKAGEPVTEDIEKNLLIRAYRLMQRHYGVRHLSIRFEKHLPTGAGMGGGSADATYMLMGINELYHLGLTSDTLIEHATTLGADCPFFVRNSPQYVTGIGEVMRPCALDLSGYRIEIEKPDVSVNTAKAYSLVTPHASSVDLAHYVAHAPVEQWRSVVHNDFEDVLFPLFPEIAAAKQRMYDRGALYASMTGSGSAVYGIFA